MRVKNALSFPSVFVLACLLFGCGRQPAYREMSVEDHSMAAKAGDTGSDDGTNTVRVAAIQCHSPIGDTEGNVRNLTSMIRQAARAGAKIVVTPEASVQGYMDPASWTSWVKEGNHQQVQSRG